MTAKELVELGKACGLETVGEAVDMVELHYGAFFEIEHLEEQEHALFVDLAIHNLEPHTKLCDVDL